MPSLTGVAGVFEEPSRLPRRHRTRCVVWLFAVCPLVRLLRMVWLTLFTLEAIFKGLEYATGSSGQGTTHVGCTRYLAKKPDIPR
jgi:hypothetical protein